MTQTKQAKHTPGPWTASPVQRNCTDDYLCRCITTVKPDKFGRNVCIAETNLTVFSQSWEAKDNDEETTANAYLLAAAPELLEALKALLGIDNPQVGEPGHIDYGQAVAMAQNAITKAHAGGE